MHRILIIALAAAGLVACSPADRAETKAEIESAADTAAAEAKALADNERLKAAGAEVKEAAKQAGSEAKEALGEAQQTIHEATAPDASEKASQ